MKEMGKSLAGLALATTLLYSRSTCIVVRGAGISPAKHHDDDGNIALLDVYQSCAAEVVVHHAKGEWHYLSIIDLVRRWGYLQRDPS